MKVKLIRRQYWYKTIQRRRRKVDDAREKKKSEQERGLGKVHEMLIKIKNYKKGQ